MTSFKQLFKKGRDTHKITKEEYREIAERYAWCCVICKAYLETAWTGWGVHHLLKKSAGGGNEKKNLVPCCNACNEKIEDKPEYFKKLGFVKYC
jgi:hypothetical protein